MLQVSELKAAMADFQILVFNLLELFLLLIVH